MADSRPSGSAAWTNGKEYGGEYTDRIHRFIDKVNQKEAVAVRSLLRVKTRQDWVNNAWLEGLKWLSEHSEMEVAQFYLGS